MISEFKIALTCIYIGVVAGIPLALLLPKLQPQWRKPLTSAPWLMICVLVFFVCALMSTGHFAQGRPYLGGFFASLATMALFVSAISSLHFLMRLGNDGGSSNSPSWSPDDTRREQRRNRRREYNEERPHSSLDNLAPMEYAENHNQPETSEAEKLTLGGVQ